MDAKDAPCKPQLHPKSESGYVEHVLCRKCTYSVEHGISNEEIILSARRDITRSPVDGPTEYCTTVGSILTDYISWPIRSPGRHKSVDARDKTTDM